MALFRKKKTDSQADVAPAPGPPPAAPPVDPTTAPARENPKSDPSAAPSSAVPTNPADLEREVGPRDRLRIGTWSRALASAGLPDSEILSLSNRDEGLIERGNEHLRTSTAVLVITPTKAAVLYRQADENAQSASDPTIVHSRVRDIDDIDSLAGTDRWLNVHFGGLGGERWGFRGDRTGIERDIRGMIVLAMRARCREVAPHGRPASRGDAAPASAPPDFRDGLYHCRVGGSTEILRFVSQTDVVIASVEGDWRSDSVGRCIDETGSGDRTTYLFRVGLVEFSFRSDSGVVAYQGRFWPGRLELTIDVNEQPLFDRRVFRFMAPQPAGHDPGESAGAESSQVLNTGTQPRPRSSAPARTELLISDEVRDYLDSSVIEGLMAQHKHSQLACCECGRTVPPADRASVLIRFDRTTEQGDGSRCARTLLALRHTSTGVPLPAICDGMIGVSVNPPRPLTA